MEELQEKTLQRQSVTVELPNARTPFTDLDEEVQLAVKCALDKKALDLVGLDLRGIASFTEVFLICSGTNQRQVQAISDEIGEQLKKQLDSRVIRIEGYNAGEW